MSIILRQGAGTIAATAAGLGLWALLGFAGLVAYFWAADSGSLFFWIVDNHDLSRPERLVETKVLFWVLYLGPVFIGFVAAELLALRLRIERAGLLAIAAVMLAVVAYASFWALPWISYGSSCELGLSYPIPGRHCR